MLSISTSSNSGALDRPLNKFFTIGGGAALALLVFFGIPARRRSWRAILGVLLFGAIVGIGIGCGSSGGHNGSNNYTVTVTGTSGAISQTATVNLTVNQ
jgi:trimeric autotransporter adhesin